MKKLVLITMLLIWNFLAFAQIGATLDKYKKKVEEKVINKVEKDIDKQPGDKNAGAGENKSASEQGASGIPPSQNPAPDKPQSIKAYSKYDFVPGEKIIGFEDFSTGSIGDFPAGWNTNGSAEIVTIDGKPGRWLSITKPGVFVPEFTTQYPDDFTLEFDMLHGIPIRGDYFHFVMAELANLEQPQNWTMSRNRFTAGLYISNSDQKEGTAYTELRKDDVSQPGNQFYTDLLSDKYNPIHVSVWRQKERVRV